MATGWIRDKQRVDRFEPEIKRILGEHLISTADILRDQQEATDLMVLELKPFRIGCRVRKFAYCQCYGNEFTIRADRPSGIPSEMTKIVDGWGDYLFYGFEDEQGHALSSWFIGDLRVFRSELIRKRELTQRRYLQRNKDGSSTFYAWPRDAFRPQFIIAQVKVATLESRAA